MHPAKKRATALITKPELLSGVGTFSCAIAAVKNGADAVFFGVKGYNMRDLGTNFAVKDMKKLMQYLHKNHVKGYLALNTIVFEEELREVEKIIIVAKKAGVDALILSDLAVLGLTQKHQIEAHVSTQASVSNSLALKQYAALGAKRIVLARELSLDQIKKIATIAHALGIQIECFVHGAMCIAVSGRCLMSHELFGKSANRGQCLQVCRRAFFLDGSVEEPAKKELCIQGDTILSAKDMKTIEVLDKLVLAGIDSFKIEGRTKPADYVAATTRCYREAIDAVTVGTFTPEKVAQWNEELTKVYNREFSQGFFITPPSAEDIAKQQGSVQTQKRMSVGVVTKYYAKIGVAEVKLHDALAVGDKILIEGVTTFLEQDVTSMQAHSAAPLTHAGQGDVVGIKVNDRVRLHDKVFKLVPQERKGKSSRG